MGLTGKSTGVNAADKGFIPERREGELLIALAGNPNVGKSTLFNALTGMNQHTGNWTGKTVSAACGVCVHKGKRYILADLPGTYSLLAHSAEEEVARDFICFEKPDAVMVVCDASCIERNLNLVLQCLEITPNVIVCVNLMDEAAKKHIVTDLSQLEELLGVPVCGVTARSGVGLDALMDRVPEAAAKRRYQPPVIYSYSIEAAVYDITEMLEDKVSAVVNPRFAALRIIDCDPSLKKALSDRLGEDIETDGLKNYLKSLRGTEICSGMCSECFCCDIRDTIASYIIKKAEQIASECVTIEKEDYYERDRKIDRILTHKIWGVPVMAGILLIIFQITITGANYPSQLLFKGFSSLEDVLRNAFNEINAPWWLTGALIDGVYHVLTWVVSVMLPPMAIFFPLFTLLEDSGYLPRTAFNLDRYFKKAGACGKQALTMAMGIGCNAAGVTGCRIIDSPRERLIAILTNCFVPCNGKYPALIAIITIFFVGVGSSSFMSAAILTAVIIGGVILTFIVSGLLSVTLLKGEPSSFTLELPSYRRPQIARVIVRSVFDRTIFVLGRAVVSAAPAGLIIWLAANISVGGETILRICSAALDPFAHFIGLDGTILLAFILGFPANEIVIPIMLTAYTSSGMLTDYESLSQLKELLLSNGWNGLTAVCTIIFMMCHFPCATTCLTVKKETGSLKWTAASMLIPTAAGIILCAVTAGIYRLIF